MPQRSQKGKLVIAAEKKEELAQIAQSNRPIKSPNQIAQSRKCPLREVRRAKILWLFNALLLLTSVVFSLLVCEIAFRIYAFGVSGLVPARVNSLTSLKKAGIIRILKGGFLRYDLNPNLNTFFQLVEFRTNSFGMCDEEYSEEKLGNVYRIAVVGDSVTMPFGVPVEKSYHSCLERLLANELPQKKIECLNFGVGGYSFEDYYGIIREKALRFDPDLILIGAYINDFHAYIEETPGKTKTAYFRSFLFNYLRNRRNIFSGIMKREFISDKPPNERIISRDISRVEKWLERINGLAIPKGIPVVVVLIGHMVTPQLAAYYTDVEKMKIENIKIIQAWHPFIGENYQKYWIHPFDAHPNSAAHKIIAQTIFNELKNKVLIPGFTQSGNHFKAGENQF